MKKLLSILLLVSLLFQASLAMALTYCQHEEGREAQHFGHHAHQHKASSDEDDKSNINMKMHPDCESCHSSCFNVFFSSQQKLPFPDNASTFHTENTHYLSYISDSLERPSWSCAA